MTPVFSGCLLIFKPTCPRGILICVEGLPYRVPGAWPEKLEDMISRGPGLFHLLETYG